MTSHPIRRGTPADEPRLRQLQSCLRERNPDLLAVGLTAGGVLVTVDDDRPVGYLLSVGTDDVYVAELVVAPAFRRAGRASALFAALFGSLSPGAQVSLAVAPDNEAALSLYRDHGFTVTERRPGYFESGAALVLTRSVPPQV